jgi:hypothetical protein
MSARPAEPVWPFMSVFDTTKTARWRGAALVCLGEHDAANRELNATGLISWAPKPRALALADHALATAALGDVEHGCAYACEALDLGTAYGSERVVRRVKVFRRGLPGRTTHAASLDGRLASLYSTAAP